MYSGKMEYWKQAVYKSDLNAQNRSNTSVNIHYCNFIFGQLQQLFKKKKKLIQNVENKQKKSKETVFRQT